MIKTKINYPFYDGNMIGQKERRMKNMNFLVYSMMTNFMMHLL